MRRRLMTAMAAGTFLAAGEARADFHGPRVHCAPGLPEGCVAVAYQASDRGFTLLLQNLQGSFTSSSYRFDVQGLWLSLQAPGLAWRAAANPDAVPDGFDGPVSGGCWSSIVGRGIEGNDCYRLSVDGGSAPGEDDHYFTNHLTYNAFAAYGLLGCADVNAPSRMEFVAMTCPRGGFDGWLAVHVNFGLYDPESDRFVRPVRPDDVEITLVGQSQRVGDATCTIGQAPGGVGAAGDCYAFAYDRAALVAPEPTSVALLGSGLLGLIGIGMVRRRSRDERML